MTGDYPPNCVIRINEVFHDVEGADYASGHPEINQGEPARWDGIFRRQFPPGSTVSRTVLDFGCGAGFVAQRLCRVLSAGDRLICADVSQGMLQICRQNMQQAPCCVEYLKLDGRCIPLAEQSCDLVTMNSVLHHLPDPGMVLREIGRVLRPGGTLVIAHEPNRRFYASRMMRWRSALFGMALSPRRTTGAMLRRLGVMSWVHRLLRRGAGDLLSRVNRRLLEQNIIQRPLTQDELTSIVDIGSPTAGGWHPRRGMDIERLAQQHLPDFACQMETYDHLGADSHRQARGWIARYAQCVAQAHPKDGATFLATLTKPG